MNDLVRRLRSLPDEIPEPEPFEVWRDACGIALAAADLIEALAKEIERLRNDLHSCGPTCDRAGCVNARLRAAMASTEEEAALWEDRARHLGWKDAPAPNVEVTGKPRAVLPERDSLPGLVRLTAKLGARRVPQENEDEAMAAAPR